MTATFPERFDVVAAEHASRSAVECDGETWTYQRLRRFVDMIASAIERKGAAHGSVIAIELDKSPEYIACVIAVWKAGCVAMPLPSSFPMQRRTDCMRRSEALFAMDGDWIAEAILDSNDAPITRNPALPKTAAEDPAYLFFTSGSTGKPKGVIVSHAGLVPMLAAQVSMFGLNRDTRSLFYLSTAFDASLSDIGTCLLAGGTLLIETDAQSLSVRGLFDRMEERCVTFADLPPSLMTHAAEMRLEPPASLRTVVIGGEVCPLSTLRWWSSRVRLINVYGPTEATICTSMELCDPQQLDPRPTIGQPIASVQYRLEEVAGSSEPAGRQHELWIGGPAVALGYLGDETMAQERFVFEKGCRWYRTGDLVQRDARGRWLFQGRIDRQFKVLGKLVEPAEIERRLMAIDDITAAYALPLGDLMTKSIGCLVELRPGSGIDPSSVIACLKDGLPTWMIPQHVRVMDRIPRTESGKFDASAARACFALDCTTSSSEDLGERANRLRMIWMQTLGLKRVGWDDDFFLIGGDSIAALRLLARCELEGFPLTTSTLMSERTIRGCLRGDNAGTSRSTGDLQLEVDNQLANCEPTASVVASGFQVRSEPSSRELRHVLLTGATGLLGANVLSALLSDPWCQVTCLIRASDVTLALRRIRQAQDRYLESGGDLLSLDCLRVICGDVSQVNWGIGASDWNRLAAGVTDVMHVAANVNALNDFQALRRDNVDSVATAIRFAQTRRLKSLWYASSLSVFASTQRRDPVFYERDSLTTPTEVYGGYGQSKWAAERLVNHHASRIPVGVLRLGLLVREHGLDVESKDQLSLFTRGIAELGVYPQGIDLMSFDLTPVDYAARAFHLLAKQSSDGVFHVCGQRSVSMKEWVESLRNCGIEMRSVPAAEFEQAMKRYIDRNGPTTAAAVFLSVHRRMSSHSKGDGHRQHDLFLASNTRFDAARAGELLASLEWRRQVDQARLNRFVAATGAVPSAVQGACR
ncbi:MAG: non-ribosomal peptide synthetase [Rubripirellula sp.]